MAYRDQFLRTFRDAVYHCFRWTGSLPQESEISRARSAVLAAYRSLFFDHAWRYYMDDKRILLDADFTDGTLAYDHAGGASERLVTWTASDESALPDWTRYGKIRFSGDDVIYKVQERLSDTTCTLSSTHNPGSDVAAATSFTLFRTEYPLTDVHKIHAIEDEDGLSALYVSPDEWLHYERTQWTSGPTFKWTITGAADLYGAMSLRVTGYPTERRSLDFLCVRRPRRLVVDGIADAWTDGTCTSATGTTVEISGNTFNSEVVGAVVRFSRNSSTPTDVEEGNPFIDQRVITAASGGTLTVDDTIDTDGVTVSTGYCVSDPVDVPEYLMDLFERWCEAEYARRAAPERYREAKAALLDARKQARIRDTFVDLPSLRRPWRHPSWPFEFGAAQVSTIPASYFE